MTGSAANPMDAVAVLMKERQRLEEWIAQLESRRSITPPHVFERVRGDYEARLREVTQKLAGRTTEVQATSAALTERLARLQSEETAIRDERYEAELRSHVGEITAAEWSAIEKTSDERIAKIASERTSVTAEIARLQQLLAMSTGGAPEERRSGESAVDAPRPASFDELEFLKSVTDGARSASAPATNGGAGRSSKPVEAPARSSTAVPRTPTPAGSAAASTGGASVPTAPAPRSSGAAPAPNAAEVPALGGGSEGNVIGSVERDAVPEKPPEPVPAFLRDVPQETAKTLRCHDCGTMNLPTEWYCERCGGELAAM